MLFCTDAQQLAGTLLLHQPQQLQQHHNTTISQWSNLDKAELTKRLLAGTLPHRDSCFGPLPRVHESRVCAAASVGSGQLQQQQ
jgi:hypothetical protein